MTRSAILFIIGLVATAALEGCSNADQPTGPPDSNGTRLLSAASECKPATPDSEITIPIAPASERVDLYTPIFSNPTSVTNPLFPISNLSQVILVGFVDGDPFRSETTLLPGTQPIDLGDQTVQTLTSQYVAYLDRRIEETALDWYGQDDDGAVWYFGEDVANYEDGRIVDTDGTWLACQDGPVAMIMPALPQVGDVFRSENVWPDVFEEIEVTDVDQTVAGPLGPVAGAIIVQELHLDATYEAKVFAPGYGEFSTGDGIDVEALALAIPTDASPLPTPDDLRALLGGSRRVFDAAGADNWTSASRTVDEMIAAWARYRAGVIPRLLKPLMTDALRQLTKAVAAHDGDESRQFALDVSKTGLDLSLQYRSRVQVDFARLDLWVRQLIIDAEAEDAGGATSDLAILKTILFRLDNTGDESDRSLLRSMRRQVRTIQTAVDHESWSAVLDGADQLQAILSDRTQALEN